ncbi:histidine kinase [Streptomyces sp. NPDC020412]|uniref:sensor histidine kinase n=1 Tax=Streptomyces sp. NPDC020412 TaxID=3365073 RepID=UPI00379FD186
MRGLGHVVFATCLGFIALLTALFFLGASTRTWSSGWRTVASGMLAADLIGLCGLLHSARRRAVWLANALLGSELPAPTRAEAPERLRTGAWLLASSVVGGFVVMVAAISTAVALLPITMWLKGGGKDLRILSVTTDVAAGWHGAWTVPLAGVALLLAWFVVAMGTAVLRWLAPLFLGPGQAERVAALEERMRVLAEGNRLAQELHDSIGHTLTAATIQAAVAGELLDSDPVAARRALNSIEETSRGALDDLDHVLGALRRGGGVPAAAAIGPTLAELPSLVDRVQQARIEVHIDIDGELERVPGPVSREAYRIVQEGLTNALRHAAGPAVQLVLNVTADRLEVELTNEIPGPAARRFRPARAGRLGFGLKNLEERVHLLHGDLDCGPTSDGRWRLAASLPLQPDP